MQTYRELLDTRIAIFEKHLARMVERRRPERRHDCFITFMEEPPVGSNPDELMEWRVLVPELMLADAAGKDAGGDWASESITDADGSQPTSNSRGDRDRSDRYVQFAFTKKTFYMDLPNNTLQRPEAERLIRERAGFFWLRERRWLFMQHQEWLESSRLHNPVEKEYLNADTHAAAEDMAWILYTLWKFPVDWQFYFRAHRFNCSRQRDWEGDGPVL